MNNSSLNVGGYQAALIYLPSKPGKYGLKIFWLAEAESDFALNAKIYTDRDHNGPPERNLGKNVVMALTEPYYHTGRDIVTINFYITLLSHFSY